MGTKKDGYTVNAEYMIDRVSGSNPIYKKMDLVRTEWTVCPNDDASVGGHRRCYYTKKGKVTLTNDLLSENEFIQSWKYIPSALALYRAISLFECGTDNPKNVDFYKMNWSITLKHKKTGEYLVLGEWKGGFQIFSPYEKPTNKAWEKSAIALLEVIGYKKMPIGYDGTVSGSVA